MVKHLISFARSPIGYILNLLCTVLVYAEQLPIAGRLALMAGNVLARPADILCARDGVQDDMLF